ncbi:hypothetical protein EJD97_002721 [Solanum chilense]|uniref:Uncharacterized protein n=1 Tax=Solanum chilense TaxID=4083 RepID=A0A6N2CFT9_SOLCI|nr:hypothetical protein EJD97_002721 [Solanum chilense]
MKTRRNADQRIEKEGCNVGDPLHDEQVPPLEANANVDQAPANPPPMTEVEMRGILDQIAQAMTTQAQAAIVQAQAMTSQDNWDVAPRVHKQTMAS